MLETIFNVWMNNHADSRAVSLAWKSLEKESERIVPEESRRELKPLFDCYLRELEFQSFTGGFRAAAALAAELESEGAR